MRAAFYERQGPAAEVLQVGLVERPEPRAGEVRVRVHGSGLNPSDTYARAGSQAPMAFPRIIPHQDGAGIIDAVGSGVAGWSAGQRVGVGWHGGHCGFVGEKSAATDGYWAEDQIVDFVAQRL